MAMYIKNSKNVKIGDVDCTYANIDSTCPNDCKLKSAGCYAGLGNVGIHQSRIEKTDALTAARMEAHSIDEAYAQEGKIPLGRNLRLHVSGDSRTKKGTHLIANAVKRWQKRGGERAWSYTHAWKRIHRGVWKTISVLASCDDAKDIPAARQQGYAPTIVVRKFKNKKAFFLEGVKFIPCPAQTFDHVTCVKCKLCWRGDFLFEKNMGIAFEAHSVKKRTLPVVKD